MPTMAAILKSLVSIIIIFKCVHTSFAYAQCMFWTQIQDQNEEMNVFDAFLHDKVLSSSVTPPIIIYKLYYQNVHVHTTHYFLIIINVYSLSLKAIHSQEHRSSHSCHPRFPLYYQQRHSSSQPSPHQSPPLL